MTTAKTKNWTLNPGSSCPVKTQFFFVISSIQNVIRPLGRCFYKKKKQKIEPWIPVRRVQPKPNFFCNFLNTKLDFRFCTLGRCSSKISEQNYQRRIKNALLQLGLGFRIARDFVKIFWPWGGVKQKWKQKNKPWTTIYSRQTSKFRTKFL